MTIKKLDYDLTVCKLPPDAPLHLPEGFFCLARTDEELSLVCETSAAPDGTLAREDAVWAYKHRQSNSLLLIPIIVQDSLYLATTTEKVRQVAVMGKDKHDEIKEAILTIYSKNQNCLIGYNNDTIAAYRQWKKQMKAASD